MIHSPAHWTRSPVILIVGTDQVAVKLMCRVLGTRYDALVSTTDPHQAPELARTACPDLVVFDLRSPRFDSLKVLEDLRTSVLDDEFVQILVLSCEMTVDDRRRAVALGATDFLTKPFDASELLLRIQNMLQARLFHLALAEHRLLLEQALTRGAGGESRKPEHSDAA